MNLNIGGVNLKLPEINLPKLNLGNIDLKKGVEALKTVAKDMFAPSKDGTTLFNKELNYKLGSFDIKLKNPVEVLSEKLLGSLSGKLKELGYNPDAIAKMLTGNRQVAGLGEVELPKLNERTTEYAPEVGGGKVKVKEQVEEVEETEAAMPAEETEEIDAEVARTAVGGSTSSSASSASASLGSGTDFGEQVISKFSGTISSLDDQINTLMNKGDKLTETEMLKLQQQMQKRSQLFQMMSQIMQMVHDTNKLIIQNMRA